MRAYAVSNTLPPPPADACAGREQRAAGADAGAGAAVQDGESLLFYDYHFSGSALINEADKNSIVCVTITQVNGGIDDNPQNDNQCLALFIKDNDVFFPYPNPTSNDVVFPVVLKKETDIEFDITNAIGSSILISNSVVGSAGLNLIPLSLSNLSSGCYIIKITINDKIFIKKIIKY